MLDYSLLPYLVAPMQLDDIEPAMEIEREAFSAPWSVSAYRHELTENEMAHYFVVRTRRPIWKQWLLARMPLPLLAYGGFLMQYDEAHISTIATAHAWRGKHLGELLLVGMIDEAQRVGAVCVTLEVRASNAIAQNLYRKYRFNEEGRRRRYYSDNGEDALIMTTDRIDQPAFQEAFAELKEKLWERLQRE